MSSVAVDADGSQQHQVFLDVEALDLDDQKVLLWIDPRPSTPAFVPPTEPRTGATPPFPNSARPSPRRRGHGHEAVLVTVKTNFSLVRHHGARHALPSGCSADRRAGRCPPVSVATPVARQNRSKLASTPRAYRLKAGNASSPLFNIDRDIPLRCLAF
jgi:hypothetical protein